MRRGTNGFSLHEVVGRGDREKHGGSFRFLRDFYSNIENLIKTETKTQSIFK